MTYPQIAVLLEVKESVAATRVQEAFAAVAAAIGGPRTETELESAVEEAFGQHADDVADHGERVPLARAGARQRRRRRLLSAAAVTASVGTVGALLAISYDGGSRGTSVDAGPHPDGWRAESYQGVQLWVPTSWGWGIVPTTTPQGLVGCRVGAFSSTALIADLRYIVKGGPPPPYVGRPMSPGGTCPYASVSNQAHVWFGSPLVVGTTDGQTTVRAHGVTTFNITVADPNRAERLTILRSIHPVDQDAHWCPRDSSGLRSLRAAADPEPAPKFVQSLSLCLYAAQGREREALFYSTAVAGTAAQRATSRIEAAPTRAPAPGCLGAPAVDRLLLIARTAAGPALFTVSPETCRADQVGYLTGSSLHPLTKESVRLWAVDGLPLYLAAADQRNRITPYLPGF